MLAWTRRRRPVANDIDAPALAVPVRDGSGLLAFIAGPFAADIAVLWPAPHTDFLLAPAARRHLAFIVLARAQDRDGWSAGVRLALTASLKTAIRALVPDAPRGLARALGRLGEAAWDADDYGVLLERLADERTAKVLRHAPAITPDQAWVLAALPGALVEAGGALLRLTRDQSLLVAECFAGIERRDGEEAALAVAERWAKAPRPAALFRQVGPDLAPAAVAPPHPGTGRLKPLATKQALAGAALRYRNCLDGRVLDGWNHYYEWLGPPGAVICVSRDHLFGWRLEEALSIGNAPLSAMEEAALKSELAAIGIHVGRSAWTLEHLAREAACSDA